MREYNESFKSKMVQRLVGPGAMSANQLAREVGVSQGTLSRWLQRSKGRMDGVKLGPPPDRNSRRPEDWSAEERLRVVTEAGRLRDDELGAFLRR